MLELAPEGAMAGAVVAGAARGVAEGAGEAAGVLLVAAEGRLGPLGAMEEAGARGCQLPGYMSNSWRLPVDALVAMWLQSDSGLGPPDYTE